ncbi:MAG: aspartate kinase [Elusimicrobia bacterium RIFOXYA2_FULL_50_26]|nr:MAG: aspartate kinase [Elusimicrobia bacterium RIFOXYA2_FULL_50_26]
MSLVVMKFGGSSVADAEKIKRVAGRVIDKKKAGNNVVVVVSAPGDMTDDLITLAEGVTDAPDEREMDMLLATGEQVSIALLCMAIKHKGEDAVSLTGPQAGIHADTTHTRARITKIIPTKVHDGIDKGRIVIVAGFQGINPNEDITTLGRGGSDLTAVALAAALKADTCEIYTDVEGVYTTDPRVVKKARKIERISYDEMLEMAGSGAQVMQARSIEVAKKYGVDIHVRSTFTKNSGTLITGEEKLRRREMEDVVVSAVTFDRKQAKLSIVDVADRPGIAARVFGALAKGGVNVDMIIQSAARDRSNDISFTISRGDVKKALALLEKVKHDLHANDIISDDKVAKVSIVGVGMRSHPGVAAKMFETLSKNGINIEMISTSEIIISCAIRESEVDKAVTVLHKAFGLNKR